MKNEIEVELTDVTNHGSKGYREFIGTIPRIPVKPMRKLGIRIRKISKVEAAHSAFRAIEIFDVETGEAFGNFSDARVLFPIDGAIQVEAKFYPALIETLE